MLITLPLRAQQLLVLKCPMQPSWAQARKLRLGGKGPQVVFEDTPSSMQLQEWWPSVLLTIQDRCALQDLDLLLRRALLMGVTKVSRIMSGLKREPHGSSTQPCLRYQLTTSLSYGWIVQESITEGAGLVCGGAVFRREWCLSLPANHSQQCFNGHDRLQRRGLRPRSCCSNL